MNDRYKRIMASIRAGNVLLIDGATGTEVERRGVPMLEHAWNGGGALTHSEVVQGIHEDYIRAGANIIISNTFATHRSCLEDAGVAHDFDAYNRRSVELACAARAALQADGVLVAGGLSHWSFTKKPPPLDVLEANATEQAQVMADAGADLLMLEMMMGVDRLKAVLNGALSTGLPVWPGFTCTLDEGGKPVMGDGDKIADAIAVIRGHDVDLINVMHTDVPIVGACLDEVRRSWDGEVGAYAHSGAYVSNGSWIEGTELSAEDYASYVPTWLERRVRVVGGCCGIGPGHITHLAEQFDVVTSTHAE